MWDTFSSWSNDAELLLVATVLSVGMFVVGLIALPVFCIRLPTDYFVRPVQRHAPWKVVLRTIAAGVLIILGLAMLVLPGQGILAILMGISLLDFPAKRAWQHRLLQRPTLLRTMNRIRKQAGKPPLETEKDAG